MVTSFASGQHQNAMFQFGPAQDLPPAVFIYNNVIANSTCSVCGGVVKLWLSGNAPNTATGYAFNNVLYNNSQGNYVNLAGHFASNYGTWYFFNNTVECGTDANPGSGGGGCGDDFGGSIGMTFVFNYPNDHFITSASPAVACDFATCSATTDLTQTVSTANGQGYNDTTETYAFSPANATGATTAAGTNEQGLCATIGAFNSAAGTACQNDTTYACAYITSTHTVSCPARQTIGRPAVPGAWDIGAYQTPPQPAVNLQATPH
jgi:hypothetical protein